jgi:hypothetical protein
MKLKLRRKGCRICKRSSNIKDYIVLAVFPYIPNIRFEFLAFLPETVLSFHYVGNDAFLVMTENISPTPQRNKDVSLHPLNLISTNKETPKATNWEVFILHRLSSCRFPALIWFYLCLFNDAVSNPAYTANDRMMNWEGCGRKRSVVTYFNPLSWHLHGGTEENYINLRQHGPYQGRDSKLAPLKFSQETLSPELICYLIPIIFSWGFQWRSASHGVG